MAFVATAKKIEILNAPQVLLVHLSRFDTELEKIHHYVRVPATVDYRPYAKKG